MAKKKKTDPDFTIVHHGSITAFTPMNQNAKDWVKENVEIASYMWLGESFHAEYNFVGDLLRGLEEANFTVEIG